MIGKKLPSKMPIILVVGTSLLLVCYGVVDRAWGSFENFRKFMEGKKFAAVFTQELRGDGVRLAKCTIRNLSGKRFKVVGVRPNCGCLIPSTNVLLFEPFSSTTLTLEVRGEPPDAIEFVLVTDKSEALKCSVSRSDVP